MKVKQSNYTHTYSIYFTYYIFKCFPSLQVSFVTIQSPHCSASSPLSSPRCGCATMMCRLGIDRLYETNIGQCFFCFFFLSFARETRYFFVLFIFFFGCNFILSYFSVNFDMYWDDQLWWFVTERLQLEDKGHKKRVGIYIYPYLS